MFPQSTGRRSQFLNVAPNGENVREEVCKQASQELSRIFPGEDAQLSIVGPILDRLRLSVGGRHKAALSYPNCAIKVSGAFTFFQVGNSFQHVRARLQWSSDFYSSPHHFEDELHFKLNTDEAAQIELIDAGHESQMEIFAFELKMQQGGGAVVQEGFVPPYAQSPSAGQEFSETESRGRRDRSQARGAGVDFMGGQPQNPSLQNIEQHARRAAAEASRVVSDLPPSDAPVEMKPDVLSEELAQNAPALPSSTTETEEEQIQRVAREVFMPLVSPPAPPAFSDIPPPPPRRGNRGGQR